MGKATVTRAIVAATLVGLPHATRAADAYARLFPWVVREDAMEGACAGLLDPAAVARAARGAMVFLNWGNGADIVRASSVASLMPLMGGAPTLQPTTSVARKTSGMIAILASGAPGTGGVKCWFARLGGAWRLASIEILTPAASGKRQ